MKKGNSHKISATSRIIVKNLPVHLTEVRLKEHFAKLGGQVTDVKIIKAECVISSSVIYKSLTC